MTKRYRYYTYNRPPGFGATPRGQVAMETFYPNVRRDIPGVPRALGWVEYEEPLDAATIASYELIPELTEKDVKVFEALLNLSEVLRKVGLGDLSQGVADIAGRRSFDELPRLFKRFSYYIEDYDIKPADMKRIRSALAKLKLAARPRRSR